MNVSKDSGSWEGRLRDIGKGCAVELRYGALMAWENRNHRRSERKGEECLDPGSDFKGHESYP